ETVRLIFNLFLEGMTPHSIAVELTNRGIKTPSGKDVWNQQTVRRMLSNEKYKGDALLQKEFTVDFLQKKMKKNEGEVPQYYVEGNHEAIISPQVFDLVQAELARRTKGGSRYSGVSIFSNKIKCGDCGSWYGSKVWHSTDRYRKVVYRCNHKYDNGTKCETPHVTEDEIKAAFVSAYNKLVTEKKEIITNAEIVRRTLCVTDSLLAEKKQLEDEMSIVVEMTQSIVEENARVAQDQDEYQKRYNALVERYDKSKARYDEVTTTISAKEAQGERLKNFIQTLKEQDGAIREFDSALWGSMVEYITVGKKKELTVTFRNGTEIQA
ncbi:MAG: recombinase family protein, partial [Clostridiales bacterium]|nr:recombinase family protein [Clostridiales bacterium]